MLIRRLLCGLATLAAIGLLPAGAARAQDGAAWRAPAACSALLRQNFLDIPDAATTLTSATMVAAGNGLPEHCKVVGTVSAQVGFEMALPTAWNERLMAQGCGGTCGVATTAGCEDMLARGFAVVHNDMGHRGRPFLGAQWAHQNLPAVIDFGYRATHVSTVAAKVIQQAFYGRPARYSYFRGCSTGGRQAMVEAQRYPEDFDGIVSIAPPLDETGLAALHLAWTARAATERDGRRVIDAADVRRVHAAVMGACDALDGASDGVLQNPASCPWRVEQLQCKPGRATAEDGQPCLSAAKVQAFRKIYDGVRDSRGGRPYPGGMALGSELGWMPYFVSDTSEPARLLDRNWMMGEFFRYLLFTDTQAAGYGIHDFDFDRDPARLATMEALYAANNHDLRRLKARGAKLILVGGWDDPLIPVDTLKDYYDTTSRLMGGEDQTRSFFRLFLVPGMLHCVGGSGADAIDYMTAMQRWVEEGAAPDALMSYRLKEAQSMIRYTRHPLSSAQIDWRRPVPAYPEYANFSGAGAWRDAEGWKARGAEK